MILKSTFEGNQEIPTLFTCMSENINPPLFFEDIPEGTKSLILSLEDTDATPTPWIHWLLFNIPTTVTMVNQNQIPEGATEGLANNKSFGYEGPCPKYFSGTHHYLFTLVALNTVLDLPAASDKTVVFEKMQGHILATAQLVGLCNADKFTL